MIKLVGVKIQYMLRDIKDVQAVAYISSTMEFAAPVATFL
jgi:hypothetical protein